MIPIGLLAVGDILLMLAAFGQEAPAAIWFASVHLGLTCAAYWIARGETERVAAWDNLVVPLGAAAGPCGIAIIYLIRGFPRRDQPAGHVETPDSAPRKPDLPAAATPMVALARVLDDRIRFPATERIESLGTILRHGNLGARRKALEAVVRSYEPRLSPLIATALTDEDQTIRSLAAAAAARASSNLAEQLVALEVDIDSANGCYALAMFLFEHGCHNVLLPQSQRLELCTRARACLSACERLLPCDDKRRRSASDALAKIGDAPSLKAPAKNRPVYLRSVETAA